MVKNTDMKIINMNIVLLTEKNDEEQKNDNNDTPNSSFDRIDINLIKKQISN